MLIQATLAVLLLAQEPVDRSAENAGAALWQLRADRSCQKLEAQRQLAAYRVLQSSPESDPLAEARSHILMLASPSEQAGREWKELALTLYGVLDVVVADRQRASVTASADLEEAVRLFCEAAEPIRP